MPKELFFSISSDKRRKVIEASIEEFSNHLFYDASINQIIKNAEISRGSFYQYFEDKEDLFFYILEEILTKKIKIYSNKISNVEKDIFSIYRNFFVYILSIFSEPKNNAFFKNFYLSMNYGFQLRFKILTDKIRDEIVSGKFNELLLSFGEKKPLAIELSKIMELINRDLILMKIIENADNEQIMEIYDMRMDLLQGKKEF